ncbi:DUF4229 domain-containing protein [Quadrisphaera sp. DSM 44207]|uniref:DUF4229 domain-containing protein n=1 Tax=Quadrisphaera sp. DSM 44207 TaxID=1881057 RepID=UPI001C409505|nr:DUF4229 domain-containing protein [Quadrisphaera sp. DSM 44207]
MGPFVRYTMLRLLLLAGVIGVLLLAGVQGPLLLLLAVLISAGLSYVLLAGPRQAVVARLEQRAATRRTAEDPDAAAEDAEDEALRQGRPHQR